MVQDTIQYCVRTARESESRASRLSIVQRPLAPILLTTSATHCLSQLLIELRERVQVASTTRTSRKSLPGCHNTKLPLIVCFVLLVFTRCHTCCATWYATLYDTCGPACCATCYHNMLPYMLCYMLRHVLPSMLPYMMVSRT